MKSSNALLSASTAISPPALRPGDTVAVCAPAGPVQEARLRAGLDILARRYDVRMDPGALSRQGFLAGDDSRRADELNRYLRDPDVRCIIAARGGYGLLRIVDRLDADALRRDPKILVGFSDLTVLLSWAIGHAGVRCVHGPMVAQLSGLPESDVAWLISLLETAAPPPPVPAELMPIGPAAGAVEGVLLGGNLCLMSHLLGTPYHLDYTGAIVVVEEVGETPYRLDRYFTQLGLAGVWQRAAGVLIGDMTDCEAPADSGWPGPMDVVMERVAHYGVPGLRGLPLAHGTRNLALPMGGRCVLDQAAGVVHLLDAAVASSR